MKRSDIRVISGNSQITEWVDKSHLLSTAADREDCTLMWHKIVLLQSGALGRQVKGALQMSDDDKYSASYLSFIYDPEIPAV